MALIRSLWDLARRGLAEKKRGDEDFASPPTEEPQEHPVPEQAQHVAAEAAEIDAELAGAALLQPLPVGETGSGGGKELRGDPAAQPERSGGRKLGGSSLQGTSRQRLGVPSTCSSSQT